MTTTTDPTVLLSRFLRNVERTPTCWLWRGSIKPKGYGVFPAEKTLSAHRFIYEMWCGPIPTGFQIDHLCRTRHCVNPDHMEAVTPRQNTLRGFSATAINARKTHCPAGHPLTIHRRPPWRDCPTCLGGRWQRRRRRAAERIIRIIDTIEARCLAADGPVTPTTREITDEEHRALERLARRAIPRRDGDALRRLYREAEAVAAPHA